MEEYLNWIQANFKLKKCFEEFQQYAELLTIDKIAEKFNIFVEVLEKEKKD